MPRKHVPKKMNPVNAFFARLPQKTRARLPWLLVALVILTGTLAAIYFTRPKVSPPIEVAPPQAFEMFQQGAFVLDVRSQAEWDQFHIAGSTLIPLNQLADRISELSKEVEILIVCRSGSRSVNGAEILAQSGFSRVYSLAGGLLAWQEAGYPLEGTP